jgi:hypothetical protein
VVKSKGVDPKGFDVVQSALPDSKMPEFGLHQLSQIRKQKQGI